MSSDLHKVMKPIAEVHGLPDAPYTSPALFDEERERLLFDNWAGIGFARDIPEPGDANHGRKEAP